MFESFIQQLHQHAPAPVVLATLVLALLVGAVVFFATEKLPSNAHLDCTSLSALR